MALSSRLLVAPIRHVVALAKMEALANRIVFDPELNPLGAENQTGRAARPTELGNEGVKMSRLSADRAYSGCQLYGGRHRDFECA